MSAMASQITRLAIVYSIVYSGADQGKHQSSALLAFVRGIHRWPVNSSHKGPVTRKTFPFDDVIMKSWLICMVFHCIQYAGQLKHKRIHAYDKVMTWERFPRYWYFVRTPYKGPAISKSLPCHGVKYTSGNGLLRCSLFGLYMYLLFDNTVCAKF